MIDLLFFAFALVQPSYFLRFLFFWALKSKRANVIFIQMLYHWKSLPFSIAKLLNPTQFCFYGMLDQSFELFGFFPENGQYICGFDGTEMIQNGDILKFAHSDRKPYGNFYDMLEI